MAKYDPNASIFLLEKELKEYGSIKINGYILDELAFQVLKCLVTGKGIKLNEKLLHEKLGVHRNTISSRISRLLEEGCIAHPICRFPNFFTPPNYILTISLVEVKKLKEKILHEMIRDPHITMALNISHGKYSLLLFGSYRTFEEHEEWEVLYDRLFPECIGDVDISYLSPKMTICMDQQKLSLGIIKQRYSQINGKEQAIKTTNKLRNDLIKLTH